MNPIDTEEHIRNLDMILAGAPKDSRMVHPLPKSKSVKNPEFIIERYVITDDGKMRVEHPKGHEATGG